MDTTTLLAPMKGAVRREVGGVQVDVVKTGNARVKRIVYPKGFRWSSNLKDIVGTPMCMHAHVGFLASGEIDIQYADGTIERFVAPQAVAIAPGHDGWVVGTEPAILIEFDFEGETVERMGVKRD
ncbi:hypothetical protein Q3A66_01635 [Hymenobacter sp. BT770]|uniref:hypothetical protein n=1 Tax=Hymenobacter sp. BT770 TaxID=2886942 RepID=UPI001D117704|nr:hypothetical protein [Hymenobacter sp. BT770]MCC3151669.1 hypothetical protein [Hymenobacter sp. BT770]MDO3413753.1 hypothetical protein [Hymenobacter sp. BT770]